IPYLNLFEHSAAAICCLLAILFMMRIVLFSSSCNERLRVKKLSLSMHFYLVCHSVCCALMLPYLAYMVVWWRASPPPGYDPYTMFYLGCANTVYLAVSP